MTAIIPIQSRFNGTQKLGSISIERLDAQEKPRIIGQQHQVTVPTFFHPRLYGQDSIRVTSLVKTDKSDIHLPEELSSLKDIFELAAEDHYGVKGYSPNDWCYIDLRQGIVGRGETLDTFGVHSDTYLETNDAMCEEDDPYYISNKIDTSFFPYPIHLTESELDHLKSCADKQRNYDKTSGQYKDFFEIALNQILCDRLNRGLIQRERYGENTLVNTSSLVPHCSSINQYDEEVFRTFIAIRFLPKKQRGRFEANPALEKALAV